MNGGKKMTTLEYIISAPSENSEFVLGVLMTLLNGGELYQSIATQNQNLGDTLYFGFTTVAAIYLALHSYEKNKERDENGRTK